MVQLKQIYRRQGCCEGQILLGNAIMQSLSISQNVFGISKLAAHDSTQ